MAVAEGLPAAGLVLISYPLHPPGKPDRLRIEHFPQLDLPCLFVSGTRDPFGNREEVARYPLSPSIRVKWLEDGDHDSTPRRSSGRDEQRNWQEAVDAIAAFLDEL